MPNPVIINAGRFTSGESITLLSTGVDRCLLLIPLAKISGAQSALTISVGAKTPTIHQELFGPNGASTGLAGFSYILDADYPAAGSHVATFAWDGMTADTGIFIEYNDADQANPLGALAVTSTYDLPSPISTSVTLASESGKLAMIIGMATGGSFMSPEGYINSTDALTQEADSMSDAANRNSRIVAYSTTVASASEVYGIDYSLRGVVDQQVDTMFTVAFAVNAPEANIDPVLDTPQADVTIQEGQTGTIAAGSNFSDANPGDTLTFSVTPNINLVTGFTFSTVTGDIDYDGSQIEAAAVEYTVVATDGNGGSTPVDVFTIEVVTASFVINTISSATPEAGGTLTVTYSNAAGVLSASCSAGALNKVSDVDGVAVFDVPIPPAFGDKTLNYLAALDITFSDGTDPHVESITIQVPSSERFAQIATIDPDGIYDNDVVNGLQVGMYAHAKDLVGDMILDLTTGLGNYNPTINNSFNYAIYDGIEWSTYEPVIRAAETTPPVITLNGSANLVHIQGEAWVDPGATVEDNVDATRQITSSSAPNINTVGTYILPYNTKDAAGNDAITVNRTVTVSSADTTPVQFSFVDVANAELNTLYENVQQITGVDAGQTLTAVNGLVSNDGGVTWSSSCQMVTGQTYVKAFITTSGTNSLEHTQVVTVNGISDTFSVTTKAAVTRTFSFGSSDPVVDNAGANLTYTYPLWELWDKIPEDETAIKIDSGVNLSIINGVGSVQTSLAQLATTYVFIARDSGSTPANYMRTVGQVT